MIHLFPSHTWNDWLDILLVQHLLDKHPFAAGFIQACNTWNVFLASLRNCKNPDGKLMFGVQGIDENVGIIAILSAKKQPANNSYYKV